MGENREYITHPDEKGSINIAEDVVAIIAAEAALETEGVAALSASLGKDIAELLGGKKNLSKGVRVTCEGDVLTLDVYIIAKLGAAVNKVGAAAQEAVAQAVESTTGFAPSAVNVHVCGVALDKDK